VTRVADALFFSFLSFIDDADHSVSRVEVRRLDGACFRRRAVACLWSIARCVARRSHSFIPSFIIAFISSTHHPFRHYFLPSLIHSLLAARQFVLRRTVDFRSFFAFSASANSL